MNWGQIIANHMQQKYLHEHCLSSNLINDKLRQQMYLKHLREVEKINNREADALKKGLEEHRSVGEIHKHNKRKAFDFKLREKQHLIEQKNEQIHSKITGILADRNLRGHLNKSLSITESTDNLESVESKQKTQKSPPKKPSFHYNYRKKKQEEIQIQNTKLMKAIICQRSSILPALNGKKRSQSNMELSRNSPNRYDKQSKSRVPSFKQEFIDNK